MPNNEQSPSEFKKWFVALALALVITAGSAGYVYIAFGTLGTFMMWSFISAAVASLLYATSLSASSVSHYTGFPNMRHGYQKQIGVTAFFVSVFYSISLLILYPETYWYGFFENFWTVDIITGLVAMTIFGTMFLINTKWIAPYFDWSTIKFVLGLGFFAYALLVVRAIWIEWPLWEAWITTFAGFPPGRLVLSVIALFVLSLRLSVPIHKKLTAKPEAGAPGAQKAA